MKGYYISRNYKSLFNAAGKAKTDCENILAEIGFKNLGFKQSSIPSSALGTIKNTFGISIALLRLPFKSVLCTQYPLNKFRNYIMFVARLKKCQIITIVHDVKFLKGRTRDANKELRQIASSKGIIVHNASMKQWFLEQKMESPIAVLGIFDYLLDKGLPNQNDKNLSPNPYEIVYAGGLSEGKNAYLYDLDQLKNDGFIMNLYGIGFDENKIKVNKEDSVLSYKGAFPSDVVAYHIEGSFGLVWDGISTEECSGQYGQYLKFNNPHKTSLYILCGLPVIVWDQAAISNFIVENNIGFTVSNLNQLSQKLQNLSKEEYQSMKANVEKVRKKIIAGGYLKDAINQIVKNT
ncbi:beta-1,6-galactofuranosyltransferase [Aquimarina algicola]|uniref:Beta-1,6-galactofuranosyltransferase n=1 Tax=Aquimarina algicola TaxID=2589995 RepID=A0A504J448_9FLAO|nr:beta-1,6-galactofuranosyltransferase [Aquimarina algicola]TPN82363.1 beta-1,6-galactofuranosyltransferase [Aquimarina algicola]